MSTAYGITLRQNYEDIADAIRQRGGFSDTYMPSEMAPAILAIPHDSDVRLITNLYVGDKSSIGRTAISLLNNLGTDYVNILSQAYDDTDSGEIGYSESLLSLTAQDIFNINLITEARVVSEIEPIEPWNPDDPYN